ncbi:MAG: ketopantoate reductase family protein [Clostridia bacterium]
MAKRIVIMGVGALGGYVGGNLSHLGHDVTFVDPWPEHVETIRARGLELDGITPEERFVVPKLKILHVTEAQCLARTPADVAIIAMKSYDTAWAAALIAPYVAPGGFAVSLQNCMNEETIASVFGWGRTVGVVASLISVDLYEPGRIRRTIAKGGDKHTVFRVGEPHGRITPRIEEIAQWLRGIDSSKTTANLWGERWTKLVQNAMGNPVTAATGMTTPATQRDEKVRRFALKIAAEGVRIGQALGFQLEKIRGIDAERMARAGEGDREALAEVEAAFIPKEGANPRADVQRPSMAQDILKGRRTEIDAMNGFIARKGAEVGIPAPANQKIAEIVTRIERGEAKPSPSHLQS